MTPTLDKLVQAHTAAVLARDEFLSTMYEKYDDDIDWSEDWEWEDLLTADEYSHYLNLTRAMRAAYKAKHEAEYLPPTAIERATNSVLSVFAQALPWAVIAFVLYASNAHL